MLSSPSEVMRFLLEGWAAKDRPRWIQAAAGGRWEEARGLDLPADAGAIRSLVREWGPGDVAVELEWLGHPLVFVGARRAPGANDGHAAFEDAVARAAQADPSDPAAALAELAGAPPSQPDHVELGAANAWQSVGPLRLWSREDGRAEGSVESLLRARPELTSSPVPVALEVSFTHPRPCWIGVEVSRPRGDGHAADLADVEALLSGLFSSS